MRGSLTFDKDASFTGSRIDQVGSGPGGAIFVHVKRSVKFIGELSMIDNFTDVGADGALTL